MPLRHAFGRKKVLHPFRLSGKLIYEKDYNMPDDIFNGLCKILYPGGGEQGDWG
jgi:hypothetical protein